jgi:hypothetical protein
VAFPSGNTRWARGLAIGANEKGRAGGAPLPFAPHSSKGAPRYLDEEVRFFIGTVIFVTGEVFHRDERKPGMGLDERGIAAEVVLRRTLGRVVPGLSCNVISEVVPISGSVARLIVCLMPGSMAMPPGREAGWSIGTRSCC